nr:precorrin-6y C5,15-methyltransferase (decarboxylating) subunit CbiE [Protofrankia coriariae]
MTVCPDDRPLVVVVGVGADGWGGLTEAAREALRAGQVLMGSRRQLALVPADVGGRRVEWPTPLVPALPGLLAEHAGARVCCLASGDPMFFGLGTTLVRLLGARWVRVLPHPSSVSLACARLGWAMDAVDVVSLVGRPLSAVHPAVQPGRRLIVLCADGHSPTALAGLLVGRGYGGSSFTVLENLGADDERCRTGTAASWCDGGWHGGERHDGEPTAALADPNALADLGAVAGPNAATGLGTLADPDATTGLGTTTGPNVVADLNLVAVECEPGPDAGHLPRTAGLPDNVFEHDGQLTKREVRAVTLARLGPAPGELLWDVGAGSGSIAIEWMRTHPACRAIAVEPRADRAARILRNADALGTPGLRVAGSPAPAALAGLPTPSAVFVGGGITTPGVLERCWAALPPGGRLVANAVTVESEAVLAGWHASHGGDLVRLAVARAEPVGGFTGWRPMLPVTQWAVTKTAGPAGPTLGRQPAPERNGSPDTTQSRP